MRKSQKEVATEKPKGILELVLEKSSKRPDLQLVKLVDELEEELGYDRDRIVGRLMELNSSNKIRIVEKNPYRTLASYIFSPMALWFLGAVLATLASLALISVTSGLAMYLRYLFGGLLVLFLPGYALIELLYAKRKELDDLTRIALSIGLSLALVPLTGLVLNYTPFGIRLIPVAVSLAGLTLILLFLAARRKHTYYKLANNV